jgi:glycosyltransferase involved in cell wall biosynthesis
VKPRLLFLVGDDVFFCSHRLPLAAAAVQAGYDVTVATHVTTLADRITATGARLVPLRIRRATRGVGSELAAAAEIVPLYRRLKPDIVHHVAIKPVVYGSLAARLTGVPYVVNAIAGLGWVFLSDAPLARTLRPLLHLAFKGLLAPGNGRVIVQNPDDRAVLIERGLATADHIVIIRGSGVDLAAFAATPLPAGLPIVVLPARLLVEKGVREFAQAAGALKREGVAARFVLVGAPDPSNRGAIPQGELDRWVREGSVEWWGHRDDMPAVLAQSTIVCLPTYREGLPKSLLEGAAAARPLMATDVPGCREAVRDGENGLLVPPRDAAALAAALRTLLTDPERCRRMGAAGRALAEREFSVDQVVRQTLDLYASLLGRAPRHALARATA